MNVLTPWFPPKVKPVRKGLYMTRYIVGQAPLLLRWTGEIWTDEQGDCYSASRQWRGLAFDPATAAPAHTDTRNYVCFEVPK